MHLMHLHPSVDPSLTHFFGEFPGFGLDLIPGIVHSPRGEAHAAENLFQISALAGV